MISEMQSESQSHSDRSYVDLGLILTQKILATKTKLKEINPTLIYQWDGETVNNQISGKGTFYVRNGQTNQLVYECEVKKWKNNVPEGIIKMKKVNFFSSEQITDYKVKQIHIYEGHAENLKKHGKGTYTFQEFYSSGKVKKTVIVGQWSNDILVQGVLQNQFGKKDLNLAKNMEWSKSAKSIVLDSQRGKNSLGMQKQERQPKQNKENRLLKQNTNLVVGGNYKQQKYLDLTSIR